MAELLGTQPLHYNKVAAIKDRLGQSDPAIAAMPLTEFAALANRVSGTADYSAGLQDDWIKQLNRRVDQLFSPISEVTRSVGGEVGELFNERALGEQVGEGLPRGLAELMPVAKGYQVAKMGSKALGALTAAPGLASTAGQTYAATDSPGAAAVSALGMGALFPMAGGAERLVGKGIQSLFYKPVADAAGKVVGRASQGGALAGFGERVAEIGARETAAAANQLATMQGVSQVATGEWLPFDKRLGMEVVGANLPFLLLDVPYALRGLDSRNLPGGRLPRSVTEGGAIQDLTRGLIKATPPAPTPPPPNQPTAKNVMGLKELIDDIMASGKAKVAHHQKMRSWAQKTLDTLSIVQPGVRVWKPAHVATLDRFTLAQLHSWGAIRYRPDGSVEVVSEFLKDPVRMAQLEAARVFERTRIDEREKLERLAGGAVVTGEKAPPKGPPIGTTPGSKYEPIGNYINEPEDIGLDPKRLLSDQPNIPIPPEGAWYRRTKRPEPKEPVPSPWDKMPIGEHKGPVEPLKRPAEEDWRKELQPELPGAKDPATALRRLELVWERTVRQVKNRVREMTTDQYGSALVVEGNHEVFGFGRYLKADLGATDLAPLDVEGRFQVLVSGKPTDMVWVEERGVFQPADPLDVGAPGWKQPVVTKKSLQDSVTAFDQQVDAVRRAAADEYYAERQAVLDIWGFKNEEELAAFVSTPVKVEAWDKFRELVEAKRRDGVALGERIKGQLAVVLGAKDPSGTRPLHEQDLRTMEVDELEQLLNNTPIEWRAAKVEEVGAALQVALREAVRTTKGELHEQFNALDNDYRTIEADLKEAVRTLPLDEAAERVYRSRLARLAELSKRFDVLNDRLEREMRRSYYGYLFENAQELGARAQHVGATRRQQLAGRVAQDREPTLIESERLVRGQKAVDRHPLDSPNEREVMAALNVVEQQEWGKGALTGLARVFGNDPVFKLVVGGGQTVPVDIGALGSMAVFRTLQRFAKLAEPGQWEQAWKKTAARAAERGDVLEKNSLEDQARVAFDWLTKDSKHRAEVLSETENQWRSRWLMDDLDEAAKEFALSQAVDASGLWAAGDPQQLEKVALTKRWWQEEFKPAGEGGPVRDAAFWGDIVLETVREVGKPGAEVKPIKSPIKLRGITERDRVKRWNQILGLMRTGQIPIVSKRAMGLFEVGRPENEEAVMRQIGWTGTWKNLKQQEIDAVVGRLRWKFHKWLLKQQAGPETSGPLVSEEERPSATGVVDETADQKRKRQPKAKAEEVTYSQAMWDGKVMDLVDGREMVVATRDFYRRFYAMRGLKPEEVELYSDIVTKVALAFRGVNKVYIGELAGQAARQLNAVAVSITRGQAARHAVFFAPVPFHGGKADALMAAARAGHEFTHVLLHHTKDGIDSPELALVRRQLNTMAEALSPDNREAILKIWHAMVYPQEVRGSSEFQAYSSHRYTTARQDPKEFLADLGAMTVVGLVRPDLKVKFEELLKWGGPVEQTFFKALITPVTDMTQGLADYVQRYEHGKQFGQTFVELGQHLKGMFRTAAEVDKAFDQLKQMEVSSPAQWTELLRRGTLPLKVNARWTEYADSATAERAAAAGREALGLDPAKWEEHGPVDVPALMRVLFPSAQLSEMYPALQAPFDVVRSFRALANTFARNVAEPVLRIKKGLFGLAPRETIDVELTGLNEILTDPAAERAATEVALREQVEERLLTESEIREMLSDRSTKVQDAVIKWEAASSQMMVRMADAIVKTHLDMVDTRTALVLMHANRGMSRTDAVALGKQLTQLAQRHLNGDPDAGLQAVMQGVETTRAFSLAVELLKHVDKLRKQMVDRPWFRSEMRLGRYYVAWKEPGGKKGGTWAGQSRAAVEDYARRNLLPRGVTEFKFWDKYDRQDATRGMHPDFLASLQEIESAAWGAGLDRTAKDLGLGQDAVDALRMAYVPLSATAKEIASHGIESFFLGRKLRPGREELNMPLGTLHYVQAMSTALAKKKVASEFALALADPSLAGQDALKKVAREHYQAVVNPSAPELSTLKKAVFSYFLAFSPSQMFIEGTQSLSTVVPQLVADSGGVGMGYRYLGRGSGRLATMARRGDGLTGDPTVDPWLKRARDEKVLDFGVAQEFVDNEMIAEANLGATLRGRSPVMNAVKAAKSALQWTFRLARDAYAQMPRMNAHLTFFAALDMAREHGVLRDGKVVKLSGEAAYEYAKHTVEKTLFGGGAAARPVGLFANKGETQGVIGLMYSLGTFTFSTLAMYTRLAMKGIQQSVPAAERAAARRAFGVMLTTQGALAGGLGLPFATAIMAVVEQLFPELEVKKNVEDLVRDGMTRMMGEDEELGGIVTDMALRGLPFGVIGVDLSSRLALSNLLGVSPYDGFTLENLVGPAGSVVGNMFRAVKSAKDGDVGQAVKSLVPTPFKPVADLVAGGGTPRDRRGRPILRDMNMGERIMYVTGFRPARLTQAREAQQLAERHDALVQQEQAGFHRDLAKKLLIGDVGAVREALVQRQTKLGRLRYDAVDGARAVVEAAVEQVMPLDPAATGSRVGAAERERIVGDRGLPRATEVERVGTKKTLERRLGVPGSVGGDRRALQKAQMVDYLMQSVPGLSRQEALGMADEMVRRRTNLF